LPVSWVRDDGLALMIRHKPPRPALRLQEMRDRAKAVGGRLDVRSKAGDGTLVDLTIPAAAAYAAPPRRLAMSRLQARPRLPDDGLDL
jgi:nitrate/nitrite-specific signal transduction histidine kinase